MQDTVNDQYYMCVCEVYMRFLITIYHYNYHHWHKRDAIFLQPNNWPVSRASSIRVLRVLWFLIISVKCKRTPTLSTHTAKEEPHPSIQPSIVVTRFVWPLMQKPFFVSLHSNKKACNVIIITTTMTDQFSFQYPRWFVVISIALLLGFCCCWWYHAALVEIRRGPGNCPDIRCSTSLDWTDRWMERYSKQLIMRTN